LRDVWPAAPWSDDGLMVGGLLGRNDGRYMPGRVSFIGSQGRLWELQTTIPHGGTRYQLRTQATQRAISGAAGWACRSHTV
jgi:hypothetical protein